ARLASPLFFRDFISFRRTPGRIKIINSMWRDGRVGRGPWGRTKSSIKKNKEIMVLFRSGARLNASRSATVCGEMAERSKAHAWKACRLQKGLKGSNPFLSAIYDNSKRSAVKFQASAFWIKMFLTPWRGSRVLYGEPAPTPLGPEGSNGQACVRVL